MCLFLSVLSGRYLSAHISLVCHSCLFCIDCYFPIFLSPRSRQLFPPCLTVIPSVCLSVCLSCLSLCDMSVFLSVSPVVPSVCLSFRLSCWSFCLFVCPSFLSVLFFLSFTVRYCGGDFLTTPSPPPGGNLAFLCKAERRKVPKNILIFSLVQQLAFVWHKDRNLFKKNLSTPQCYGSA